MNLLKKYWDILGGFIVGIGVSVLTHFQLNKIQLIYSIIILILVCIGVFKIIKQAIEKNKEKRPRKHRKNVIDAMVDNQKPVKAISLATNPTRDGEELGKAIIETMRGARRKMKNVKVWFDKFKGYILAVALMILTIMEYCGSFINDMFKDKLEVNGVNVIPIITLAAAVLVGILSNGFTKEQWQAAKATAKAIRSKGKTDNTDALVLQEIKRELKVEETKLTTENKNLTTLNSDLDSLNEELTTLQNTHSAKVKMFNMVPQLATEEVVQNAANAVVNVEAKIDQKKQEIAVTSANIANLEKTIAALKAQL